MIRALALLPLAALTLGAKDDPLAGRVAGKPQQCIDLGMSDGPTIVDSHTILYRAGAGRRVWQTGPVGDCPWLRPLTTLIVHAYSGSQLCANDRFQVLEPGVSIPSANCRFTPFTPYDRITK
ncbi:hypothetical protein [Sphingomonas beigongshangi]|uniref:hypothetical protein n=1 Tax=Sphingomonas beigongshangi TaxID=2782540 RepID=UPI001EED1011|nr:hypothetical protein [Sphingomonas beigongshangi]